MTLDLTAETPAASTVPHPFGSPTGPGLWHVKGMMLPAYIQNVAHALLRDGAAQDEADAIQKAVGIVQDWAAGRTPNGKGRVHADVQAAASKAVAEWEAKRARAHAQAASHHDMTHPVRKERTVRYDQWGQVIDLATAPPSTTGPPNTAKRKRALSKGAALPPLGGNPAGSARFPIENTSDLQKATRMVQLAKGDKTAIRRYIMARAKALGASSMIPDNWNADGTVGAANSTGKSSPFPAKSS
jgi:hypothetical protein